MSSSNRGEVPVTGLQMRKLRPRGTAIYPRSHSQGWEPVSLNSSCAPHYAGHQNRPRRAGSLVPAQSDGEAGCQWLSEPEDPGSSGMSLPGLMFSTCLTSGSERIGRGPSCTGQDGTETGYDNWEEVSSPSGAQSKAVSVWGRERKRGQGNSGGERLQS